MSGGREKALGKTEILPHSHPSVCPHPSLCNFTALDTGLRHVRCLARPKMLADVMQVKASSVFALSGWPSCPSITAVRRAFPGQLDAYRVGLRPADPVAECRAEVETSVDVTPVEP